MTKPWHLISFWIAAILLTASIWFPNTIGVALFFFIINQFEIVRKNQEILNERLDINYKNQEIINRNIHRLGLDLEKVNVRINGSDSK